MVVCSEWESANGYLFNVYTSTDGISGKYLGNSPG